MTGITAYFSEVTESLNSPVKRYRLADSIRKQYPTTCCLQEMHLTGKNKHRHEVRGWNKIFQGNGA
jgi:hypothetical protein